MSKTSIVNHKDQDDHTEHPFSIKFKSNDLSSEYWVSEKRMGSF